MADEPNQVVDPTPDAPEEKKDRQAEQFEKLTKSNQELKEERDLKDAELAVLKEENEKYKKLYQAPQNATNQAPSQNQYQNLNQQQIDQTFNSMVDENGYLDGQKLMNVLQSLDQKARQAEERAQRAENAAQETNKKTVDREEKEAQSKVYAKYPQLNPDNKEAFDPKMWRAVYNALAVKAKAGELPSEKDYIEAADGVYSDFYADSDMKKRDEEIKGEKIEQKQVINSVKPESSIQAGYFSDLKEEDLVSKVRTGQRGSVAELLRRRGQ